MLSRTQHNLSHAHTLSMDVGTLVPLFVSETLPGDTFIGNVETIARVAPLANPIMHPVKMHTRTFYLPNRILWDGWTDFIRGEGGVYPEITPATADDTKLIDHFNMPVTTGSPRDALPIRAYNMIWNEFFRDPDLHTPIDEDSLDLQRVCWEKDYFTTARSSPQEGDEVTIPLSGTAPITNAGVYQHGSGYSNLNTLSSATGTDEIVDHWTYGNYVGVELDDDNNPTWAADLSSAGAQITIDDLRDAIALQRQGERRAFYGNRYEDLLRFMQGHVPKGLLDKPELVASASEYLNYSEVLATAASAGVNVGDFYGHGIGMANSKRFRKTCMEHGWLMTVGYARPDPIYTDTLPKKFTRRDPLDYFTPELSKKPWQPVYTEEVSAAGNDTDIFGYVPSYDEYRQELSFVSGTFRGGTENDWGYWRSNASVPTLNSSFVECFPTDRVYQDTSMPELLVTAGINMQARRRIPANASFKSGF